MCCERQGETRAAIAASRCDFCSTSINVEFKSRLFGHEREFLCSRPGPPLSDERNRPARRSRCTLNEQRQHDIGEGGYAIRSKVRGNQIFVNMDAILRQKLLMDGEG